MKEYKKEDFYFEEDEVISAECEECGNVTSDEVELENGECSECGGNLINETSHEGLECEICKNTFDMWEDAYRSRKDSDILICEDCYENLED